ncbi:MAG: hypothetical protein D4S02_02085 [Rhodocyclaceae bacterium]|nr:MAG: hypothetical protein D4S02_02085 [Rhodocyclaceae bacterium]
MATIFGTANNDSWTVVKGLTFTLDGLGGTDTLYLGTSLRTSYTIVGNTDGSVTIDTVSGASQVLHATLYHIETVKFDSGRDFIDLTTFVNDTAAPTVATFSPANGEIGAGLTNNIVLTFNETIQRGVGSIVLKNAAGSIVETFDVATSGKVTLFGASLSIHPSSNYAFGTKYVVEIPAGTVKDLAGNLFGGTTNYGFTTTGTSTPTSGNDMLAIFPGDNTVDGGAGIDSAMFSGPLSAYMVNGSGSGAASVTAADGVHTLLNVERLQFSDRKVALDMGVSQPGGETALLIGAVLGKAGLANQDVAGPVLAFFDTGGTLRDAANVLLNAGIMDSLAGGSSTTAYVNLIYQAAYGQAPTSAVTAQLAARIDGTTFTKADFLTEVASSSANQTNVDLVGLAHTGIAYS